MFKFKLLVNCHSNLLKLIAILSFLFAIQLNSISQSITSDTTFISRDTLEGKYHAIYIENHKQSIYYKRLTNFTFDHYDSLSYLLSIEELFKEHKPRFTKSKLPAVLPRKWCGLHSYKNNFYLYAPSDWGNNSNTIITDSTIIQYFLEGPYAYIIDQFNTIDANTFEFSVHSAYSTTTKLTIHIIDWKSQVAIFDNHSKDEDFRYSMMVGSQKARQFPIIVNYCKTQKQMEFEFDKTDYSTLLKQKK